MILFTGSSSRVRDACQTEDNSGSESLIRQAVSGDSAAETDDFGKYYLHRSSKQVNGHLTNSATGIKSPNSPAKSPKHASQHTFGFEPIRTEQISHMNPNIKINHHGPFHVDNAEYIGGSTFDASRPQSNPVGYSQHNDEDEGSFHMDDDDPRTMTRLLSDDIKINLEPQQAEQRRPSKICEENYELPPPSPCRRLAAPVSTNQPHVLPPSNAAQKAAEILPEPTETSTSSDEVSVRRPADVLRHEYVNGMPPSSATVYRGGDSIRAAGELEPEVIGRLNLSKSTTTGSFPAVRLQASQSFNNRHYRRENVYVEPSRRSTVSRSNTYRDYSSSELLPSPKHVHPMPMSQTDPNVRLRQQQQQLPSHQNQTGAVPKRNNSSGSPLQLREIQNDDWYKRNGDGSPRHRINEYVDTGRSNGYDATRGGGVVVGMTTSDAARSSSRRSSPGGGNDQPVENEEKDSLREKTTSAGDAKSCMVCNKSFKAGCSLQEKEAHINACLAENTSVPETPECPVCKQIFPLGFPEAKLTEHVNGHFNETPAVDLDRYVIVD